MSTPETLAAWTLAAMVEAELIAAEAAEGFSVFAARRPLNDAEKKATTRFGDIDLHVASATAAARPWIRRLLTTGAEVVLSHVFPSGAEALAADAARQLTELTGQLTVRAAATLGEVVPAVRGTLVAGWLFGAGTVLEELTRQGVPGVDGWVVPSAPATMDTLASNIATHPLLKQLEIASRYVADPFRTLGMQVTRAELAAVLAETSDRSGVDMMHAGVQTVVSMGRTATVAANGGDRVVVCYSSEILDRNTCSACSLVDGTRYDSLAEAMVDYPVGGFRDCAGGSRCRGLLVFVQVSESFSVVNPSRR